MLRGTALAACLVLCAAPAFAQQGALNFSLLPLAGSPGTSAPSAADQMLLEQGVTLPGTGKAVRAPLSAYAALLGGLPLSGGTLTGALGFAQQSTPAAPGSGGALYVDSSNVLHYLNGSRDFPLGGAKYNNDASINWLIGNYGVGEPSASTNDYSTFRVQKVVPGSGGSGIANAITVLDQVSGNGFWVTLLQAATSGATSIVTSDSSAIVAGTALSGAGLASGTTVSSIAHSTPSAGQATITLSAPIAANMYLQANGATTEIAYGSSGATEAENTINAQCNTWQSGAGINTCVAGFFTARKYVAGGVVPFSLDLVATDSTGRSSTNSGGGIKDAEIDINAAGPDDASYFSAGVSNSAVGIRKGLHVVATAWGPSIDGATSIADGLLNQTSSPAYENEPVTLINGTRCMGITGWGNITNCMTSDGSGAGQTVVNIAPGFLTLKPNATASSGQAVIVLPGITPATVGQLVSDVSGCVPAGATISSVSEGTTVAHTAITLSANLTCDVATSDSVTLTNRFSAVASGTATFTDAFFDLVNSGAAGVVKIGSTLASGTIAQIQMRGNNTLYGLIQASQVGGNGILTLSASGGSPLVTTLVPFKLAQYTVATLPTCNSTTSGSFAGVTDATSPTYNGTLTGGGTAAIPVYCDGSAWRSH